MRGIPIICLIGLSLVVGAPIGPVQGADPQKDEGEALAAQRAIIDACIQRNDTQGAQAAIDALLTNFATHPKIADVIYNLAKECGARGDAQTWLRLHQYNVEHYPADKNAMWSQVEIIKELMRSADDAAVDAACERLLSVFAAQETLPKEVYQIGAAYANMNRHDRARYFYQYVTTHWPDSEYAICSQLAILEEQGQADSPAFDAALVRLLAELSGQPDAAERIYKLAMQYGPSDPETALKIHQYNTRNSPREDLYTMWSQVEIARAYIRDRNEPAAKTAVEELISRFEDQPTLPKEVGRVGQAYARIGRDDLAEELDQYIQQYWADNDEALWVKVRKARALILKDDDEEAEAMLQKILADHAGDSRLPEAVNLIAERYNERGIAMEQLTAKQMGSGEYAQVVREGKRSQEVVDTYRRAIETWSIIIEQFPVTPPYTMHAWYFTGVLHRRHLGEPDKALPYYEKVAAEWPDYEYAWSAQAMIAACCQELKDSGKIPASEADARIEEAYKGVLEKYPSCSLAPQAYLVLGRTCLNRQQWDQAAAYYSEFLDRYPQAKESLSALLDLAQTYEQRAQLEAAVALYRTFLDISDPADSRVTAVQAKLDTMERREK
jgi:outer membrane protein assembly factor BamD (BamD/ComL family)